MLRGQRTFLRGCKRFNSTPRLFADGSEMIVPAALNVDTSKLTELKIIANTPNTNINAKSNINLADKGELKSPYATLISGIEDTRISPLMDEMSTSDTDQNLRLKYIYLYIIF